MKKYLAIGGPKNGQRIDREEAEGYTQFNCAYGAPRSLFARNWLLRSGRVVPETMVWVSDELFRQKSPEALVEPGTGR